MSCRILSWPAMILCWLLPSMAMAEDQLAASWQDTQVAGSAEILVVYAPSTGWAEPDEEGQAVGAMIELIEWFAGFVAEEHAIEVRPRFILEPDWSQMYARIRDGSDGLFGLGNVTITEARDKELTFSPPYVHNVAVLISPQDRPEVVDADSVTEQLAGLTGLAFANTLHEQRMRQLAERYWPNLELAKATSNAEIIERVATGGYFAFIDGYNYYHAADRGVAVMRHSAFDDGGESFGIIMPKDSDWAPIVSAFFEHNQGLVDSPRWHAILVEHLGSGIADLMTGR